MGNIDNPINTVADDRFGFARYRDALLEVIRTSETPLTVGIFGPWGTGKTSLLRLIYESLRQPQAAPGAALWTAVPVEFNAWLYDRDEALWRALILAVLACLRDQPDADKDELDRVEASLFRTVEWEELGKWTIDWVQALEGGTRAAARAALSLVPGSALLAQAIESFWSQVSGPSTTQADLEKARKAIRREVQKFRREQVRSLDQFQSEFRRLVQKQLIGRNKRLVVLIDDLDRCLPEKAIEVLETIKLFLSVEGCLFFLAADREVIERGIRVKYRSFLVNPSEAPGDLDVAASIPIAGRDYLEKIIQLPFALPPIESARIVDFVRQDYADLAECAVICAAGLEANPRKVKRLMNLLRLLMRLDPDNNLQPALLAKVVVIQSRYADLYARLFDYPGLLVALERYFLEKDAAAAPVAEDGQQGTLYRLRDRFVREKQLGDMLRLPPHFQDLSRSQVEDYLYLTRSTSPDSRIEPMEATGRDLWTRLRSGDLTQIEDAVARIQEAGQQDAYTGQIETMLQAEQLAPGERFSLGLALRRLGRRLDLDTLVQIPGTACQIGKYPVTNEQFERFMAAGGYKNSAYWIDEGAEAPAAGEPALWGSERFNQPAQPVVGVSWFAAQAYCRWMTGQDKAGRRYRLPDRDEWTRAATGVAAPGPGQPVPPPYPWGQEPDPFRANTSESGLGGTTPAGCYPRGASPAGALDMAGNVWEWLADSGGPPNTRAMLGGSWSDRIERASWTEQESALPTFRNNAVGFRVVCENPRIVPS